MREANRSVVIIGPFELPDLNAAAHRVVALGKIMQSAGYRVTLVGFRRNQNTKEDQQFASDLEIAKGISFLTVPYPAKIVDWISTTIRIKYMRVVEKTIPRGVPSIILLYNYPVIGSIRMWLYATLRRIPIGQDVTEWYSRSRRYWPISLFKNLDTFLRMHFVPRIIRNTICISGYLERHFSSFENGNTLTIPFVIDTKDTKWRTSSKTSMQPRSFVFFGSPGRNLEKDRLDWIMESAMRLKQEGFLFKIRIVGITLDEYLVAAPGHATWLRLNQRTVCFMGRLIHDDAITNVRSATYSLIVRSNHRNTLAGFPSKLSESLAVGVPVVGTPIGEMTRLIVDRFNGLLAKSATLEDVVEAMRRALLLTDEEVIEMHRNCHVQDYIDVNSYGFALSRFIERSRSQ